MARLGFKLTTPLLVAHRISEYQSNLCYMYFHRVCKENASLLSSLEARTEELRKVTSQKMGMYVSRFNTLTLCILIDYSFWFDTINLG